ncbi:diaminopimelate decarboxylase [Flavobacteriaceae bacterium]|jgi:diaminopimelate decarboxylase|nr:diaminopimelate decarboxylase [Flavobacteriaceae bacterium]
MNIKKLKEAEIKFGNPLYVYDLSIIENQFKELKNGFRNIKNFKINFAAKSLSNISILKFMKKLGAGLDTVSIEEVKIGLICGFNNEDITFTPNGVSFNEIEEAYNLKVKINLDSLESIKDFSKKYSSYPISIRVNPNILSGGNKNVSVGHDESKFGIPLDYLDEISEMENKKNIIIEGIHIHTGSDIVELDNFQEAFKKIFLVAKKFKNVKILNFGGGLKIPYFEGDSKTNILNLSNSIKKLINDNSFVTENNLKIILEPGKFLVGESGYFLTKVNYVKKTPNKVFVQLNSGFNHFIRPIFYNSYHEIINITNPNDKEYEYDVVGYVCEQDNFALKRKISNVRKGDILCFKNAGAYCSSMSSNYNSRIKPAEVCIWENKLVKIKERENLNNILKGQIDIF